MQKTSIKAIDAIQEAHKIAFAPFVFQAVVSLRKLGVFDKIFEKRKQKGLPLETLAKELSISEYGLGVLLEIAESSEIVQKNDLGNYELTTTGYFLNYNQTVNVNINFTQDVCYKGLFHLNDAIKTGQPEGLKELGQWKTIYEGLSQLPENIQKSWFEFDHHYSDDIFEDALKIVFKKNPKTLFDIGANTGKFSILCGKNSDINITMIDLPGQLNKALNNVKKQGLENQIKGYPIDWLEDNNSIPKGADIIWLCQFLDCFSKEEILSILSTCVDAMDENTELIITETYTDRQRFDNAKFILEATSLYFTALANGNSKMYAASDLIELIDQAGMTIHEDIALGEYHTMLVCKKK
ncbi:class I SAM-dependent methyltransferase [Mangrovimonas cancribranchiae]|uniref:Methyltransferase n=1 Tax=Mangrovimonas cancribranchiae TaxID=3080055 RepID=A0AAU6NWD2_9FLAO